MTDSGLVVEGPDRITLSLIERDQELVDILKKHVSAFSFGIQSPEIQRKKNEEQQRREQIQEENERKLRRRALEIQKREEAKRLSNLTPDQQFAVLTAAYPRKSVYGEHLARQTFVRLYRCGHLPDISYLLDLINKHKASADWNLDGGRWIPGLKRWLRAKPWIEDGQRIQKT